MARLEHVRHEFFAASMSENGELIWEKEEKRPIDRLPQIFWDDGRCWDEVNVWALDRIASHEVALETVERGMKHLAKYAQWLEVESVDWQHFPVRKEDRVLRKFRKHLIDEMTSGQLAASTASACMSACIRFYRWADAHHLVGAPHPMWADRLAVVRYLDVAGFQRSVATLTTDLKIPNAKRNGVQLEDGLLPLRAAHMNHLLAYTAQHANKELHLMLSTGFFTGARIGTIATLTVTSLYAAREDPMTAGIHLLPVGPGTGIATKFGVQGSLVVPHEILEDLKTYASSTPRLIRESKAQQTHKNSLFLTRRGEPYTVETASRLTYEMRKKAVIAGLPFMHRFRFHQSRATFGTWLMTMLLDCGLRTTDAIRFVRDAMLHKSEATTFGYITFLENTRGKQQLATEFNTAFTGLRDRDWRHSNE